MKRSIWVVLALAAAAGCGSKTEAPAPAPAETKVDNAATRSVQNMQGAVDAAKTARDKANANTQQMPQTPPEE